MQRALGYIVAGRLTSSRDAAGIQVGVAQTTVLNEGNPTPLRTAGSPRIFLGAGQEFRVVERKGERGPYKCETIQYGYAFEDVAGNDIITYHWTPEATGNTRTWPHLHLGQAVCSGSSVLAGRFHKLHIPTGRMPIEGIVRFAIVELGAQLIGNQSLEGVLADLAESEVAFARWRER